jgi:hypothetical protein
MLYRKTVEKPSTQSVKRAKLLENSGFTTQFTCFTSTKVQIMTQLLETAAGIHPWLEAEGEECERAGGASKLIASLKQFRPAQSILEINDGTKKQASAASLNMRNQVYASP